MRTFDKNGKVLLDIDETKELSRGGEGRVIEVSGDRVVKLYHPGISGIKEQKFNELLKLRSNTFVKPENLVFDSKGSIFGFAMKKVPSDHFPLISIFNKTFCLRQGISFNTKKLIIEKIISSVQFAHSEGIIIGDLNPYNILVNESSSVFFIDVDSYETPSFKHSGILLEDVRDFLYNGEVTIKSDYFALAVICFNALTYVHPFKGVHKKYPNIVDRMIKKESILKSSPELIIPKCYEDIQDKGLKDQFERIFNNGERFILQLSQNVVVVKTKVSTVIKTDQLLMHTVFSGNVIASASSREAIAVLDDNGFITLFDLSIKGMSLMIKSVAGFKDSKTEMFVSGKDLFIIRDNCLYFFNNKKVIDFGEKVKSQLYGNILVVITKSLMYKFELDKIYNDTIPYTITSVYGGKFSKIDGLFQNVSGSTVLFYENKGALNSSVLNCRVKNLVQSGNIGVIEKVENERIIYQYFCIKNLQTELFNSNLNSLRYLDYLNNETIVVPEDDKLILLRSTDMSPVVEFKCSEVSESSVIHCTNAGIVIVNDNIIYLVNKK